MSFRFKTSLFAAAFMSTALANLTPAFAQEVVLTGTDSQLKITGTLISADGGMFVVKTVIGEFELEQSLVTCEGPGCPQIREITADLNVAGEGDIAEVLFPIIAEGFASTLNAETMLLDANGNPMDGEALADLGAANKFAIEIVSFEGEEIANFGVVEATGMTAYEMLVSGETPIIFRDQRANKKERDFVEEAGIGQLDSYEQDRVIAVQGFAVVVNPNNPVGAISIEQLAQVMAGQITDWSELGGTAGPIDIYSYDPESETFAAYNEMILEPFELTLSPDANIVRDARELTTIMMSDEAGIGLVNYNSRRETRTLPLTSECGITTDISQFSIKTEEYPLNHRVHVYSRPDVSGYAADLLAYIDGPALDGLVAQAGFVDLGVVADVQVAAAERTAAMAAEATDAYEKGFMDTLVQNQGSYERLSTTFRFAPGTDDLDAKGTRDLARLVGFLRDRKPAEVVIVGFTDGKGTFDANLIASESRAAGVLGQVVAEATAEGGMEGTAFTSMGFGELSPVGCNSTPQGRAKNRRVEIWIK